MDTKKRSSSVKNCPSASVRRLCFILSGARLWASNSSHTFCSVKVPGMLPHHSFLSSSCHHELGWPLPLPFMAMVPYVVRDD